MTHKYGGMKRASDWDGARVTLTREVRNGMGIVPTGTAGRLGNWTRNGNVHFEADPCSCCGAVFRVSGLHYEDFKWEQPLPPPLFNNIDQTLTIKRPNNYNDQRGIRMIELNDCPFCESSDVVVFDAVGEVWVECTECSARGPSAYYGAMSFEGESDNVSKLWNKPTNRGNNQMKNLIKQGQAIAIFGPEGSGKTTIALALARSLGGTCTGINARELDDKLGFGSVLVNSPNTVIIYEFDDWDKGASLARCEMLIANRKGYEPLKVKTPIFIFVASESQPPVSIDPDCFYTVQLDAPIP